MWLVLPQNTDFLWSPWRPINNNKPATMLANGKQMFSTSRISSGKSDLMDGEPASLNTLNWLIHLQHVRGELDSCKELIKRQTSSHRGNEYAFFKQGIILREEGKLQEALDSFQVCLKLNPVNAENLKEVAKCLYEMRRFRLALEAYLEAENMQKTADWETVFYAGQCFLRLGDLDKAKHYAEKAVKLGRHESTFSLLIKILINEADLKQAVVVSNSAIESCPDSVNLLTESGLLFLKMGQTQHAFERLSSALALDQGCSKALLGIGFITQKHAEFDVALTKYKLAILHEPDSVALWNNIGMCFFSKQKYIASISCLKRALWLIPLNWKVLFNLGLVHLTVKQAASAFNFVCAAVNLRPDIADSFIILACTLIELKDPENALRALKQAALLAPDNPTVIINVAAASIMAGFVRDIPEMLVKCQSLVQNGAVISAEVADLVEKLIVYLNCGDNLEKNVEPLEEPLAGDLSPRELASDEV